MGNVKETTNVTSGGYYTVRVFQDGSKLYENQFTAPVLTVGRDQCDVIIYNKEISRKHFKIEWIDGQTFVSDLNSSNGTFVDNQKITKRVEVHEKTHIRAGKIIFQVIPPAEKKVSAPDGVQKKAKGEDSEMTLSRIALEVENAIDRSRQRNKTVDLVSKGVVAQTAPVKGGSENKSRVGSLEEPAFQVDDLTSLLDKDFIKELTTQNQKVVTYPSKKIESLVLWNKQIYDIQEFGYRQNIVVGPDYEDSIHIPSLHFRWQLSTYDFTEAVFEVPKSNPVYVIRGEHFLSKQHLLDERRLYDESLNSFKVQLSFYDVLRLEIDPNTQLYFRYVPTAQDLDKKKMFDPDKMVKRALALSLLLHVILAVIFLLIPKEKIQPVVKKAPERTAKLLVEEKKPDPIPIPLPPPPPEEEKKPEPLPLVEEKKPEPPPPKPPVVKKVEPPKLKPIVKPKLVEKKQEVAPKPMPKPVMQPRPVQPVAPAQRQEQKSASLKKVETPTTPQVGEKVETVKGPTRKMPPAPPQPKPVDVNKLGALAAISGMKMDPNSKKAAPVNINVNSAENTITQNDISTAAITDDLKNQASGLAAGNSTKASGPIRTKGGSAVGKNDYGAGKIGEGTGRRQIKGAVIGKPSIATGSAGAGKVEGLSREQVMKTLQSHLNKIQSCYERSLLSDPNLAGRIEFEWVIAANGRVSKVDIKKNSVAGGEQLGECVISVIKAIQFPAASNRQETYPSIGFPFGRL